MTSFEEYYWSVIKHHYRDYHGIASRKQYWLFVLWNSILIISAGLLSILFYATNSQGLAILFVLFLIILILGTLLPGFTIQVRRLHDGGFSGWLLLLALIPYFGVLTLFILYLMPTKKSKPNLVEDKDIKTLDNLFKLKESGAITEEEYKQEKRKLFN